MKWSVYAALFSVLTLGAMPIEPDRAIAYELAPTVQDGAITGLEVTIRLRADEDGSTTLDWIGSWGGERELGKWARDIRIEGATSVEPAPFGGRTARSAPFAPLVMRYRIVSAYDDDPSVTNSQQPYPIIRPDWFYAIGEVLYARPAGSETIPASFAWRGPSDVGFASDTEHAKGLNSRPRTVADITESIAIGGYGLAVSKVTVDNAVVRVAHVGDLGFDPRLFETLAQKIIAAERAFWRDASPDPFLITAVPLKSEPGWTTYSGTGRGDAFATWIQRGSALPEITFLLAHEYFHTWNSRQLGRFPKGNAAEAYWLSEGFTDFYARRLLLRTGIWSPQQFAAAWNEMLRAYAASPVRTLGNVEAATKFWSGDYSAEKLPYQRGALLAVRWDGQLKAKGKKSLDAVIRTLRDRTSASKNVPYLTTAVIAELSRAQLDVRADVEHYIVKGKPLLLPSDAFGRCARLATEDVLVFERGWNAEATARAGRVLVDVDPASNAFAAGLRDGMRLIRLVSGEPGNSEIDYVVEVQDGSIKRRLSFRPAGRKTVWMQRIVLDLDRFATSSGNCSAGLAG